MQWCSALTTFSLCSGLGMKLLDRASINSWDTSADYNDAELESGFREAMEVAGVSDLDEFMALFDEREKRNFALFNTCNDNDEELNVLVEKIQKMRVECSAIEKDMQNGWGNEMVKTLHHKRDQIKVIPCDALEVSQDSVSPGISMLFHLCFPPSCASIYPCKVDACTSSPESCAFSVSHRI